MIRTTLCWLGLLSLLMSPLAAADEAAAIRELNERWLATYQSGDLDGMMELYHRDAFVALSGQPALSGVAAIRSHFEPRLGSHELFMKLVEEELEIYGDTAHMMALFWLRFRPKEGQGASTLVSGRSLLIYRKTTEGVWKLYRDLDQKTPDAVIPPPPEAGGEF